MFVKVRNSNPVELVALSDVMGVLIVGGTVFVRRRSDNVEVEVEKSEWDAEVERYSGTRSRAAPSVLRRMFRRDR